MKPSWRASTTATAARRGPTAAALTRPAVALLAAAVALAGGAAVLGARQLRRRHAGSSPLAALSSTPRAVPIDCPAPALGGSLPAMVYLPPGYRHGNRRYPVVYFLHGLPAGPDAYRTLGFVASAIAAAPHTAIVVIPQGARSAGEDREYLDWGPTEDWPRALARQLPACIDRRYRTIASRNGRVLAGLSASGYGALNIGLRHLATFAALES
jgi:S-formylglutathione hydrolase FrmB